MIINNSNGNHHYLPSDFGFSNQTYNQHGNGDVSIHPFNHVDSPAANNTAFTSQEMDHLAFWRRFKGTKELGLTLTTDERLLDLVGPPPPKVISSTLACKFSALSLRIGTWEKISTSDSCIKCKGFPNKSSFAWEWDEYVDDKRLKKKIEFEWSSIIDMKVHTRFNRSGLLTFKLKSKPSLKIENYSITPGEHTKWMEAPYDFTDNQASLLCTHVLKLKPGILEKHYHYIMKAHPDPDYYRASFSLQDVTTRLRDIVNCLRYDDTQMQTPHEGAIYNTNNDYNQNNEMSHLISVPYVSSVIDDGTRQLPSSSMNEASSSGVKHTRSWEIEDLQEGIVRSGTRLRGIVNYLPGDNNQLQTPYEDNTNNYYNQNEEMRHLISVPDLSRVIDDGTRQLPSSSMNEASSSGVQRACPRENYLLECIVESGTKKR